MSKDEISRNTIFKGRSLKKLAAEFGNVAKRKYQSSLEFWKATAVDDRQEYAEWKQKIKTDPPEVGKNAKNKLLDIMRGGDEEKKPYLTNENVLLINPASGFYDDLLPHDPIVRNRFSSNVNYLIDMKNFTIVEEILPHQQD